ncbi:hypothetical protein ACLOJK_007981 [Asimina triloba]
MGGGADFNRLNERCLIHILAFTSPRDVCRLSAVCRKFQAAAESEAPWERFLPSDWWQLIPRSVSALHFTSKRDLFFRLCKPILIDDGTRVIPPLSPLSIFGDLRFHPSDRFYYYILTCVIILEFDFTTQPVCEMTKLPL